MQKSILSKNNTQPGNPANLINSRSLRVRGGMNKKTLVITGRCKDCKHWQSFYPDLFGRTRQNECFFEGADQETLFEPYAEIADDYGLEFGVRTGPEFGCIHFKAKGENKNT